jgi:hypothetical protein
MSVIDEAVQQPRDVGHNQRVRLQGATGIISSTNAKVSARAGALFGYLRVQTTPSQLECHSEDALVLLVIMLALVNDKR